MVSERDYMRNGPKGNMNVFLVDDEDDTDHDDPPSYSEIHSALMHKLKRAIESSDPQQVATFASLVESAFTIQTFDLRARAMTTTEDDEED